jgi:hypothetical protein
LLIWCLVLRQKIEFCNSVDTVAVTRQAFSQTTNEPEVEAESVMVKYCFESCSECRRLECGPKIGLSRVLRLFFPPPASKSTEAVRTCLCSGGARFKSLPIVTSLFPFPSSYWPQSRQPSIYNRHISTSQLLQRLPEPDYTPWRWSTFLRNVDADLNHTPERCHLNNNRPEKLLFFFFFWGVHRRQYLLAPWITLRPFPCVSPPIHSTIILHLGTHNKSLASSVAVRK